MFLMRTHNPSYARSEYHTQLAKMSFDKIFDLTSGLYFFFLNNKRKHRTKIKENKAKKERERQRNKIYDKTGGRREEMRGEKNTIIILADPRN